MKQDMNWILAISSTSHFLNVAVFSVQNGQNVSFSEFAQRQQAGMLHTVVGRVLADAGITLQDLSLLAVCTGPGSYTGIRIGMSAVLGYQLALEIPAVGVSSLDVLAQQMLDDEELKTTASSLLIPCVEAHSAQLYVQKFDATRLPLVPPMCLHKEDVLKMAEEDDRILLGSIDTVLCPVTLAKLAYARYLEKGDEPLQALYVSKLPYKKINEQGSENQS